MYPSFGCTAGQLQTCVPSPERSLQGGWRGSCSEHLQMGSVGGLSHCGVGCVSHCHPEASQTGTKHGGVEDDWEVPRITMVSCKPHMWGHCRVLGGTFSPSCRGSDDDGEEESAAQGNRQTHDNLYRVHMPSLYSCGSSYGSETSIPAAAHTVSNAPVTEYMWVSPQEAPPHCFPLISVGSSAAMLALLTKW